MRIFGILAVLSSYCLFTIGLFALDPLGQFDPLYQEPTPVEKLQSDVWIANWGAGLSPDFRTYKAFREKRYAEIRADAIRQGIDPNEVF